MNLCDFLEQSNVSFWAKADIINTVFKHEQEA